MYRALIKEAEATGDPVRATKCRAIRREARERIVINCPVSELLSEAEILAIIASFKFLKIRCVIRASAIEKYGRLECRKMIDRPLPFVVAYDPDTDPVWPF